MYAPWVSTSTGDGMVDEEKNELEQLTNQLLLRLETDRVGEVKSLLAKASAVVSPLIAVVAAIWAFAGADATKTIEFQSLRTDVAALKVSTTELRTRLADETREVDRLKILADQGADRTKRIERIVLRGFGVPASGTRAP